MQKPESASTGRAATISSAARPANEMRVDSSSTISIAGLSLILVLSSAGRGSAAPELIVNESAFACHHHGKQLMLRSEEHTSELQSLMRISYAVSCLNKKNNLTNT